LTTICPGANVFRREMELRAESSTAETAAQRLLLRMAQRAHADGIALHSPKLANARAPSFQEFQYIE
ncbi:MAG: hypothetical protein AAF615_06750, partial [Pseudomonadota bacterium]